MLHQETSSPGRVGRLLQARGCPLDIRKPRFGDPLPDTLEEHSGAVIFGGPMSANDSDDFVKAEIDWISVPLREGRPFLGICLGAQMLARNLGAAVGCHPRSLVEIGYYGLEPTAAGKSLIDWPAFVYQWHREGFDLPRGGERLARSEAYENQAFRYGPAAFGLQFHSELTLAMLYRWTVRGAHRFSLQGAQGRGEHFSGRILHDTANLDWLDRFLGLWLECDAAAQAGGQTLVEAAE